jgi:hypothetical protein
MSQIRNCKLAFQCEKEWESLTPIPGQRTVRHCTDCRANVFLCNTDEDLAWMQPQGGNELPGIS